MPLIYINGISGAGKSSVMDELGKRDYETHGIDEEGYADWIDRQTKEIKPFPHDDPDLDIHGWFAKHHWVINEQRVRELHDKFQHSEKFVFLCGNAGNEEKVWDYFDKILTLTIDTDTILKRLQERTTNHFGKTPEEVQDVLRWHKEYDEKSKKYGALLIDATQALDDVVDEIIRRSKDSN